MKIMRGSGPAHSRMEFNRRITTMTCDASMKVQDEHSGSDRGVATAGDTGDASPVRPTMSPLHQNDNRQFVFVADF